MTIFQPNYVLRRRVMMNVGMMKRLVDAKSSKVHYNMFPGTIGPCCVNFKHFWRRKKNTVIWPFSDQTMFCVDESWRTLVRWTTNFVVQDRLIIRFPALQDQAVSISSIFKNKINNFCDHFPTKPCFTLSHDERYDGKKRFVWKIK